MKKGRAGTMTHDYKRHGVTTLFAALDVLQGKVIGQCMKRHRHQEFIRFPNVIDAKLDRLDLFQIGDILLKRRLPSGTPSPKIPRAPAQWCFAEDGVARLRPAATHRRRLGSLVLLRLQRSLVAVGLEFQRP